MASQSYYAFFVSYIKFSGIHQTVEEWSTSRKLLHYTKRTFYFLTLIISIVLGVIDVGTKDHFNFVEVVTNLSDASIYMNSTFRLIYVVLRGQMLLDLIAGIDAFPARTDNGFEDIDMYGSARLTRRMEICWIYFSTVIMSCVDAPIIYDRIANGNKNPLNAIYTFYDVTVSPYYEFTILFQVVTQVTHVNVYIPLDIFFYSTIILLNKQFEILASNLKNAMYTTLLDQNCTVEEVKEFKADLERSKKYQFLGGPQVEAIMESEEYLKALNNRLGVCIRHHQALLELIVKMEDFFSLPSFLQVFFSTAYIMFSLFTATMTTDKGDIMNSMSYLSGSFMQISLVCIFGQQLSNKAESLHDAIYEMPWYLVKNKGYRLTVLILQDKLKKPVEIVAGKFFALSHATYVAITQTAFTYFTVLREVTGQD